MIVKNLLRRKGRTGLTLIGIAIGVAAIVGLGAVVLGMRAGFTTMTRGSQTDLVLTQADAVSAMLSSFDRQVTQDSTKVLGMVPQESIALGVVGGMCGILAGFGLGRLMAQVEGIWGSIELS